MAIAFFFGLGTGTVFTFLPTFAELLGVRGLGLFYTAYAAAAMLVRIAGGTLIDTRGRRAVIVPAMFVQAVAGAILVALAMLPSHARVPVLPFLFLAGLLAGGAHGYLYPALSALLMDVTPEARRASVVGLFSSVILVGHALGSVAFGYVAHGFGYPAMWGALTALLAVGFLLSLRLHEPPARPAPRALGPRREA
jgi:MFS family permease